MNDRWMKIAADTRIRIYTDGGQFVGEAQPSFELLEQTFPSSTITSFSYNGVAHVWFVDWRERGLE